ncbi:MAG: hypothetical protein MUE52_13025 [Tabrizicola sp.]|nr:hypothetical protein [Tabrizicola sp.]
MTLSLPIRADPERALAEFRERPLLAEGRRPILPAPPEAKEVIEPEIPPPTVVETPPARPALVMLGSIEKSDGRQVLLRDDTTGHEAWLGIGDAQAGWTVVAIQPESVTLQLQGAEITLHLFN